MVPSEDVDTTELVASYLISQRREQLDNILPAHTHTLTHTPTYCTLTVRVPI